MNAFTLWKPEAVKVTAGSNSSPPFRRRRKARGSIARDAEATFWPIIRLFGLVDVFAAMIPTFKFAPGVHVNYAETVLPMHDGLTKFKDFPAPVWRVRGDDGEDERITTRRGMRR